MSELVQRHAKTSAVITGGAQGVGLAIARQLASEGCSKLTLAGRDTTKGANACRELEALGCAARFIPTDISDPAACLALIDAATANHGSINALVNAAALGARGTLLQTTPALWDAMFDTNARGPFFLMQGFVRHRLKQGGGGAIVNILSQCAHCGQSYLAPYSGSKGALATLTKVTAQLPQGIIFLPQASLCDSLTL